MLTRDVTQTFQNEYSVCLTKVESSKRAHSSVIVTTGRAAGGRMEGTGPPVTLVATSVRLD